MNYNAINMMIRRVHSKSRRRLGLFQPQLVGKYDANNGQWDGDIQEPFGYSSYVFWLLGLLLIGVVLVVILVPTLVTKSRYQREMTLPSTTTAIPTTTSNVTTTTAPPETTTFPGGGPLETTPPFVPLTITCPPAASVPLGKDWTNLNMTGEPIVGGSCDPTQVTVYYNDTLVGTITKRQESIFAAQPVQTMEDDGVQVFKVPAMELSTPDSQLTRAVAWLRKQQQHYFSNRDVTLSFPQSKMSVPNQDNTWQTPMGDISMPLDPTLDVGDTEVVHAYYHPTQNATRVTIYDKSLNRLSEFFLASQLNPPISACQVSNTQGSPQVLFDHLAKRWIITELAQYGTGLCVYVSKSGVATSIATNYVFYHIALPFELQTPQLSLFNDYYAIGGYVESENPPMLIIERQPIINQQPTTRVLLSQGFPRLVGFDYQLMSPVNVAHNSPQPAFPGVVFMRLNDDELHGAAVPDGSMDFIDVVQFIVLDFDSNTTFFQYYQIPIQEFDSSSTGCLSEDACVLVHTGQRINANHHVLGHRVQYRRLVDCPDSPERIVGAFTTAAGSVQSKVQWFELEYNSGISQFQVRQDAVADFGDTQSRWLPSITLDKYGNIAMIYNALLNEGPALRVTSHVQTDPLNALRQELEWGTSLPTSITLHDWGRFNALATEGDTIEGRTFYGTGQMTVADNQMILRTARLRLQGDAIERQWVAIDPVCQQIEQCIQTIQLG